MLKNFKKFIWQNTAIASVEFALLVPLLLLLFLGGFETTRFILVSQKVSKTASSISDLVSRMPELTESDVSNTFNAVEHLLDPYYEADDVLVVVSSIMNDGSDDVINWMRCGGGNYVENSDLSINGTTATLPTVLALGLNEDTIATEVFYDYRPVLANDIIGPVVIYKVRYTKPRLGALTSLQDDTETTNCAPY